MCFFGVRILPPHVSVFGRVWNLRIHSQFAQTHQSRQGFLPQFSVTSMSQGPKNAEERRAPLEVQEDRKFNGLGLKKIIILVTLRIMGSQNWWFGDPRPLRNTHPNPSFLQGPVILREGSIINNSRGLLYYFNGL